MLMIIFKFPDLDGIPAISMGYRPGETAKQTLSKIASTLQEVYAGFDQRTHALFPGMSAATPELAEAALTSLLESHEASSTLTVECGIKRSVTVGSPGEESTAWFAIGSSDLAARCTESKPAERVDTAYDADVDSDLDSGLDATADATTPATSLQVDLKTLMSSSIWNRRRLDREPSFMDKALSLARAAKQRHDSRLAEAEGTCSTRHGPR